MNLSHPGDTIAVDYASIFGPVPLSNAARYWNQLAPEIRNHIAAAQAPFQTQWLIYDAPRENAQPPTINIKHEYAPNKLAFTPQQAHELINHHRWRDIPGYHSCREKRDQHHLRKCVQHWLDYIGASQL